MRTSSSHEEGAERDWSVGTKALIGKNGKVTGLKGVKLAWEGREMAEVPGSEFIIKADLVLLAMGFVSPLQNVLDAFGVEKTIAVTQKQQLMVMVAITPVKIKYLLLAICVVVNHSLYGLFVKADSARER